MTATGGWLGFTTERFCVAVLVAPELSVTVNETTYVPVAANVCDGVAAVDVPPSPKFHEYDAMEPSGSPEPMLVNVQARPLHFDCWLARGGRLGATAPAGTYTASACCFQLTPVLRFTTVNGT